MCYGSMKCCGFGVVSNATCRSANEILVFVRFVILFVLLIVFEMCTVFIVFYCFCSECMCFCVCECGLMDEVEEFRWMK